MELEPPPDAALAPVRLREGDSSRDRPAADSHPGQALPGGANARLVRGGVPRIENRRPPHFQSRSPGEADGGETQEKTLGGSGAPPRDDILPAKPGFF